MECRDVVGGGTQVVFTNSELFDEETVRCMITDIIVLRFGTEIDELRDEVMLVDDLVKRLLGYVDIAESRTHKASWHEEPGDGVDE